MFLSDLIKGPSISRPGLCELASSPPPPPPHTPSLSVLTVVCFHQIRVDECFNKRCVVALTSQHLVTWQPSKDGDRLIGRILLNKRMKDGSVPRDSGALLGLKVRSRRFTVPPVRLVAMSGGKLRFK